MLKKIITLCAILVSILQTGCALPYNAKTADTNFLPPAEMPAKEPEVFSDAVKSGERLEIERLIVLLDSHDWDTREDAGRQIRSVCENIGEESLDMIQDEIRRTKSLKVMMRLEVVYKELEYSFENIVQDPSFEKGLECWKSIGVIKVVQGEKNSALNGYSFLKVSDGTCVQDIKTAVRPNVSYYFGFWYRTTDQASSFSLSLSNGSIASALVSVPSYSQRLETDGKWHKIACMNTYNTEEQVKQWPHLVISVGGKGCIDNVVVKAVPEEFCPGICRNMTFDEFNIKYDMGAEDEAAIVIMSRCIKCGFQERTKVEEIFSVCPKCVEEFNLCPICGKLRGHEIK